MSKKKQNPKLIINNVTIEEEVLRSKRTIFLCSDLNGRLIGSFLTRNGAIKFAKTGE